MDYTVHGILQVRILEWVAFSFSRGSSQPRLPTLWVNSLPAESQGSPGMLDWVAYPFSSRSIFLTQELNWSLMLCRQVLNQLSYQVTQSFYAHPFILITLSLSPYLNLSSLDSTEFFMVISSSGFSSFPLPPKPHNATFFSNCHVLTFLSG